MMEFSQFHFLRPWWLLALLPTAAIVWAAWRRKDPMHAWHGLIDTRLLDALLLRNEARTHRLRPVRLLTLCLLMICLAMAGPSWDKQPVPFAEDQAALMLVVKVTPSMLAEDIAPNRLERTVQKIHDLLALKPGQRVGLVAYAGSAHLVMPLTSDAGIIETFAAALEPEAMPIEGDDPVRALELANRRLIEAGTGGSIILFADSIDSNLVPQLDAYRATGGAPANILAVAGGPEVIPPPGSPAAPALNEAQMRTAAKATGGSLTLITPDQSDVNSLAKNAERRVSSVGDSERTLWRDRGYYLLPVIALLILPFFRVGGALVME